MKLAEALALRADARRRLEQLTSGAVAAARYQEGDQPTEDPTALLGEARATVTEIEHLVRRIHRTNSNTELEPGMTLTDAIAMRDTLKAQRKLVMTVADAARGDGVHWGRRLRSELREVTSLPVADLRREADQLAGAYRVLDSRLQAANWTTELLE